ASTWRRTVMEEETLGADVMGSSIARRARAGHDDGAPRGAPSRQHRGGYQACNRVRCNGARWPSWPGLARSASPYVDFLRVGTAVMLLSLHHSLGGRRAQPLHGDFHTVFYGRSNSTVRLVREVRI